MAKNSPFHVIFGFFRQKSEKTAKNSGSEKNELHRRPSLSHSQWLNGEYATLIGRGAALCEGVYARRNEPCLFSPNLAIFSNEHNDESCLFCNFEHFLYIFCIRKMKRLEDREQKS